MSEFGVGDFVMPLVDADKYLMALPVLKVDSRGAFNGYMFYPHNQLRAATQEEIGKYVAEKATFEIGTFVAVIAEDGLGRRQLAYPIGSHGAHGFRIHIGTRLTRDYRAFQLRRGTSNEIKRYIRKQEDALTYRRRAFLEEKDDLAQAEADFAALQARAKASGQLN